MKNLKLIALTVLAFVTIASTVFVSCQKQQEETSSNCKACDSNTNFEYKTISLLNKNIELKVYGNAVDNTSFSYADYNIESIKSELLSIFKIEINEDFKNYRIASATLFSKNIITNNLKIESANFNAILFYLIKGNIYKTVLFEKRNGVFLTNPDLLVTSEVISSNDINNISQNVLLDKCVSTISFIGFSKLLKTDNRMSTLQTKINSITELKNKTRTVNGPGGGNNGPITCNAPCPLSTHAYCTAQESQSGGEHWFCAADIVGDCMADAMVVKIKEVGGNLTNYNFEFFYNSLYSFRDQYLSDKVKGKIIIADYYELSKKLPLQELDLSFCTSSFDFVTSKIIPIANDLVSNPNSNSVLIKAADKVQIVDYLILVKNKYQDIESKNKIDKIIDYVILFEDKSNYFITNYLSN